MKTYFTQENTTGFNDRQLEVLNKWVSQKMENEDESDSNFLDKEKNACDRALNFYQEILGDAGVDYDE